MSHPGGRAAHPREKKYPSRDCPEQLRLRHRAESPPPPLRRRGDLWLVRR